MGEAKRRKNADSFYGRYPKSGRGLIISNPIEIGTNGSINIISSALDPLELRRSLLFWDRLEWPVNRGVYVSGSGAEVSFLKEEGILARPVYSIQNGTGADFFRASFRDALSEKERVEPGRWAIAGGPKQIVFSGAEFRGGRGVLFSLFRTIPIPDKDVPLEDILDFKQKRRDEILKLVLEMDGFYQKIINSADSEHAFVSALTEIELSCSELIKVAKEAQFPFRLSDLKLNTSLNIGAIAAVGDFAAKGALLGAGYGLETIGGIVGGALPFIGLSKDFSFQRRESSKFSESPFRVVGEIHERFS
jgi:hypothetical protein